MFKTNANTQHALKQLGRIKMSNLCTEIFQMQEASFIADYGKEDEIKYDVNCTLASLNMVPVMDAPEEFEEAVFAGVDMLTSVSEQSLKLTAIQKLNKNFIIGLGNEPSWIP
jgi:ribonucleoside-diphosphate reductase alpha chain